MIHHSCFKCGRRMELDPVLVGIELSQLKKKNPSFYKAQCPACQAVNKVSVAQMQGDLDSVAAEVAEKAAELEKAKAEARAAKKAAREKKAG